MAEASSLDPNDLQSLVEEFDDDNTVGFMLTGSYARGNANFDSDIDLLKFVKKLPTERFDPAQVRHREGRLVTLSFSTVEDRLAEMERPETSIWVVPSLRQAKVLSDKTGALGSLQKTAEDFVWEPLRTAALRFAARELAGLAEEVYKILGAIRTSEIETLYYGTTGLILGITKVAAVVHGVMVVSENSYFRQVQATVGSNSSWTAQHKAACGIDDRSSIDERAAAALALYVETTRFIKPVVEDDGIVIKETVTRVERFLNRQWPIKKLS